MRWVVLLLLVLWPQHGTTPGTSHGKPGGPPEDITASTTSSSVYDSATAIWCFNDNTDLGDDCASDEATYDLTPVNTPTATGGALGYALANDGTEGKRAAAADSATLSAAGGSFTACFWTVNDNPNDNDFYIGKDDWGSQREWHFRNDGLQPAIYYSRSCNSFEDSASTGVNLVAGERNFVCGWYDSSTKKGTAWVNGTEGNTGSAMATDMGDCTSDFVAGDAETAGSNRDPIEGTVGPVYWWKGEVVADATLDLLYNSGKGMTCEDAAAVDTMTACWDLDEDPSGGAGAYKDSVGSEDMSPEGTPLQVAGLVERSDSGMGANTPTASGQRFTIADAVWNYPGTGSFSFTFWFSAEDLPASTYFIPISKGNGWEYQATAGYGVDRINCQFIDNGPNTITAGPIDYTPEEWHFVACVLDATTGKVKISVDGSDFTVSAATSNGTIRDSTQTISIGASNTTFSGVLDNVAFFKGTALTQEDVTALYAAGEGLFYPES